jgi:hypothetical protein
VAYEAPAVGPYGEIEPPDILARNLVVGARLAAAAQAFALLSFVFAYLYLRALNSNGNWRPKHAHIDPSAGLGVALAVCLVVCALAYALGVRRLGVGTEAAWRRGASVALLAGLAAFGVIIAQFAAISFGPTSGGYASVFIGWHALYALNLLLVLYWLETLVAQSLRTRSDVEDVAAPVMLLRPSGYALAIVLYVTVGFGLLGYVLLYIA